MLPYRIIGEERMAVVETVCFDCVAEPVRFRWRVDDVPSIKPKHVRRRCASCKAVAKARSREAEAEAHRVRERELVERGREQERRRVARYERKKRSQLKSVPKRLRKRPPAGQPA